MQTRPCLSGHPAAGTDGGQHPFSLVNSEREDADLSMAAASMGQEEDGVSIDKMVPKTKVRRRWFVAHCMRTGGPGRPQRLTGGSFLIRRTLWRSRTPLWRRFANTTCVFGVGLGWRLQKSRWPSGGELSLACLPFFLVLSLAALQISPHYDMFLEALFRDSCTSTHRGQACRARCLVLDISPTPPALPALPMLRRPRR